MSQYLILLKKQDLIRQRAYELVDQVLQDKPDVLFLLDRSARPIFWLFSAAWDANERTAGIPKPKVQFLSIGTEKQMLPGAGAITLLHKKREQEYGDTLSAHLQEAQSKFLQFLKSNPENADRINKLERMIRNSFALSQASDFSGNFLIVDTLINTGGTVALTTAFLEGLFPKAHIAHHAFFQPYEDRAIFNWGVNAYDNPIFGGGPWSKARKHYTGIVDISDPKEVEELERLVLLGRSAYPDARNDLNALQAPVVVKRDADTTAATKFRKEIPTLFKQ